MTNHPNPDLPGGPGDLLAILTEAFVKWQRPCRMYGMDITAVDMTLGIEPSTTGWQIVFMSPNHLVRIR
jgi:hypothetical protein